MSWTYIAMLHVVSSAPPNCDKLIYAPMVGSSSRRFRYIFFQHDFRNRYTQMRKHKVKAALKNWRWGHKRLGTLSKARQDTYGPCWEREKKGQHWFRSKLFFFFSLSNKIHKFIWNCSALEIGGKNDKQSSSKLSVELIHESIVRQGQNGISSTNGL